MLSVIGNIYIRGRGAALFGALDFMNASSDSLSKYTLSQKKTVPTYLLLLLCEIGL